jgi:NitT/TauT family transport system substrate-binding protein
MMLKQFSLIFFCSTFILSGCGKNETSTPTTGPSAVQLTLDWKPEPEFGGFYAASDNGKFSSHGLNVSIEPAGAGAPTWQLVATGRTEFATSTADQVLIARKQNADVVAIFTVYQTFPQGIMVHQSRGFKSIKDVFTNSGVLLAEDNSWLHFLENKFSPINVKITGYDGGVAQFLAKTDYSQQCFITSEPIMAKRQGGDPQTFLIADEGFNPYTTVVICKGELWREHPDEVKSMVAACREGWRDYLDNPDAINVAMHQLNSDMDLQTFGEGAAAQKPLIETDETKANGLGSMTLQRWKELAGQLTALGVIDSSVDPAACFVNANGN